MISWVSWIQMVLNLLKKQNCIALFRTNLLRSLKRRQAKVEIDQLFSLLALAEFDAVAEEKAR